jgi:hypothetical protein
VNFLDGKKSEDLVFKCFLGFFVSLRPLQITSKESALFTGRIDSKKERGTLESTKKTTAVQIKSKSEIAP